MNDVNFLFCLSFLFPEQMEMHPSKSAVGLTTLCSSIQTMGERLTHLYLAHNRLTGIPQIVTSLSVGYQIFFFLYLISKFQFFVVKSCRHIHRIWCYWICQMLVRLPHRMVFCMWKNYNKVVKN